MPPPTATAATTTTPTRDRIVQTALHLFSERGTLGTSMRDLAEAAGVTVPGLYYHFDSKRELIRAVFAARGFHAALEGQLADSPLPRPLRRRVAEQARRELARMTEEAEFLRLMVRQSMQQDPDAQGVADELAEGWRARWAEVIAGAADIAPRADVDAAVTCVTTFLWGLFVEHLSGRGLDAAARIDALARLLAPALTSPRSPK